MADRPDLEARARAGGWLRPGEAAQLLGVGRTTLHRRLEDGTLRWRFHPGGKQRLVSPEDVVRLLDASRAEHRGEMPAADAETPGAGEHRAPR